MKGNKITKENIARNKRLQFSVDLERNMNLKMATLTQRNNWADQQILLYDSQQDFNKNYKQFKHKPNSTVRNVAGFRQHAVSGIHDKTLFSNSFIRDSVLSTLKHVTDREEASDERSLTSQTGEIHELNKPKLNTTIKSLNMTQNEAFNLMLVHQHKLIDETNTTRRKSILSQTSYFNDKIIDKPLVDVNKMH